MKITSAQIRILSDALPGCTDARRRSLLPRIFKEWSQFDLEEHLTRETTNEFRARRRQIGKVAKLARELARALSEIDSAGRFDIASQQAEMDAGARAGQLSYDERCQYERRLKDESKQLVKLAEAATQEANRLAPLPRRRSTVIRYLVLLDLAAICEWATRRRAARRVRTRPEEAGMTYGPFWDFACAAWPIIFGSISGLENAFKTWAEGRRRHRDFSPIMANLAMSHPQWGIFATSRSKSTIRQG